MILTCVVCKKSFDSDSKRRKYCSPDCEKAKQNERNKEYKKRNAEKIKLYRKQYVSKNLYGQLDEEAIKNLKIKTNHWIDNYKAAEARKDVGTMISMLAKAWSDMPGHQYISYGYLMAIKESDPVKFFKMCSEVIAYKDSEVKKDDKY